MQTLAQYAVLCQEAGVMPIIEPEVLMDGDHSMSKCFEITGKVLQVLFDELTKRHIDLTGMLLKPNMILPGTHSTERVTAKEVAEATVACLLKCVPVSVPGIVFLSGGQSSELASLRLNQINKQFKDQLPWKLSFSFSRAIQLPALKIWKGNIENKIEAQNMLRHRAACNNAACSGEYTVEMETLIKQDKYL
jgi:fructose-bisphosphate aldolase class I